MENAINGLLEDYIKTETLGISLVEGSPSEEFFQKDFLPDEDRKKDNSIKGEKLSVGVKRSH